MHRTASSLLLGLAVLAGPLAGPAAAARSAPPPKVDGLWCGNGLLYEFRLQLTQQADAVQGTLQRKHRVRTIAGRLDGTTLHTETHKNGSLVLELEGDELRITGGDGPLALTTGQSFARARGASCG